MIYEIYKLLCPCSRFKCESNGFDPTGIIGSGLSFVGGLISNHTNKKIAREQMAQQERFFNAQMDYTQQAEQRAYDYADKAWERENAYNDPASQRARFENAGLNPAMMMQGQNAVVGSMQSVTGGNAAPGSPSPVGYEYRDPITPAVNTYLQSRLLSSQVEKNEQDAYQVQIDNRTRAIRNIADLHEIRSRIELNRANALKAGKDVDYLDKQIDAIDLEIQYEQMTLQSRVKEQFGRERLVNENARSIYLDNLSTEIENEYKVREKELGLQLTSTNIQSIVQSIFESRARSAKERAEELYILMQKNNIDPSSSEGQKFFDFLDSQIAKNRTPHILGSDVPGVYDWIQDGWSKVKKFFNKYKNRNKKGGVR